jgi:hypothetical protein
MITVTTTQVRPSVSVPFFLDAEPVISIAMEDIIRRTNTQAAPPTFTISEDMLTHEAVATYDTQQDLDTFLAEVAVSLPHFFTSRENYCLANNIGLTRVIS